MQAAGSRAARWALGLLAGLTAILVVALITLALFDWNRARGWIGEQVEQRTGREFVIGGDLDVRPFSLAPRIRAEAVRFGNAEWGRDEPMIELDTVEFSISLPALLRGRIYFPDVALGRGRILLQRDAEGRRNWVLRPDAQDEPGEAPGVGRLAVERGRLALIDEQTATDLVVTVRTVADGPYGAAFEARGAAKGYRFRGEGRGGGLLSLQDASTPYPLQFTARLGEATIRAEGTVTGLAALTAVNAQVSISGRDIAALADALQLSFPHTAPYRLSGRLTRQAQLWSLENLKGRVGNSDIAGGFSVDLSGERPTLRGNLRSDLLDLADLGGLIGARPGQKDKRPGKVLPAEPVDLGKMRRVDAHVTLSARKFRNERLPLDLLDMKIELVNGRLRVDPLVFGVAGGRMNSQVEVDARADAITTDVVAAFRSLRISRLVPGTAKLEEGFGLIDGKVQLKGRGNSAARMLGTSNGRIDLVSQGGEVSNLVMEVAGADVGEITKFFVGGDRKIALRCGVLAFDVRDGVMRSEALVVDTDDTYIGGKGAVSLREETLDLEFVPLPKDVSILSIRGPLHVRGTFAEPQVALDRQTIVRKVGMALLLGLLNPLAAIIPTIETGPGAGKEAPCSELLAALQGNIKGGKRQPVPRGQREKLEKNIEGEKR